MYKRQAMLKASYNVHRLIRRTFGQVPGGMFGADENARLDVYKRQFLYRTPGT